MSFRVTKLPARLRDEGTAFEQRLLDAASLEEPSRELSERMAQAIGVSALVPTPESSGAGPGSEVVTPKAMAGATAPHSKPPRSLPAPTTFGRSV